MADKKITELNQLAQANVNAADMAAVADISANETRKVSVPDLAQAGIRLMPADSIPGAKLEDDAITSDKIADNAVTTDKIADGAVTTDKIPNDAVTTAKIDDDAITSAKIADGEIKLADLDAANYGRGLDKSSSNVGITNSITGGTFAGITFTDQGLISAVDPDGTGDVPRADLPIATATDVGVSSIPTTGGLTITGTGELSIDNTVTGAQHTKITYDEHGLVTAGENIGPADLPIATNTTVGAVQVPATDDDGDTALDIAADGDLTHATSGITEGTYEKVTVNKYGHVTAGTDLVAADIPNLDASKITSGTLGVSSNTPDLGISPQEYVTSIPPSGISRRHFSNTSISYIQEAQPTSTATAGTDQTVFRGCLWFKESTGQLYMFNGNGWHIVAGGQLTQENLRFCGTYNAETNAIVSLTDEGTAEQLQNGDIAFTVGDSVPNCDDKISGCYFLVETAGSNLAVNDVAGNDFTVGDLLLAISQASGWVQVEGSFSGGGGGGGFWQRSGAAPDATLTPINAADNLELSGGDWLKLPRDSDLGGPPGAPAETEGAVRWNNINNYIEVWTGTEWVQNAQLRQIQWETIEPGNGDDRNDDWAQTILRPTNVVDVAIRPNRSLVFENGVPTDANLPTSGDATCQLKLQNDVDTSRTYELPNGDNGTVSELATQVILTDASTIDCGTYS